MTCATQLQFDRQVAQGGSQKLQEEDVVDQQEQNQDNLENNTQKIRIYNGVNIYMNIKWIFEFFY